MTDRARWALAAALLAALLVLVIWLVMIDAPALRFLVRLYRDKAFLKETVVAWGWAAPVVFVLIQALQVIISPIPGEITGPVGGALFGTAWGLFYSTIGLTIGTLTCFAVGRLWGEPFVRPWLSEHHWSRMSFVIEAEGAIICFVLYLIPGLPKDILSYLFGISPIPFWVFAVVSTLGRIPGTFIGSFFGANVAQHEYIYTMAFVALLAAVLLPIFYYRERIIRRLQERLHAKKARMDKRLDEGR